MEELHELLGNMALTAGMLTVSFGIVIYRYAWFKGLLGARRNLFLSWHLIGAGLCVAFLFDH